MINPFTSDEFPPFKFSTWLKAIREILFVSSELLLDQKFAQISLYDGSGGGGGYDGAAAPS